MPPPAKVSWSCKISSPRHARPARSARPPFSPLCRQDWSAGTKRKGQTAFECSAIGVLGHSQGGWIVPVVASENKDVAFAASWSGAGVTVDEQILYQSMTDIANRGTYRFVAKWFAPLIARSVMKKDNCRMLIGFDPIPYWRQVTIPAFLAFGEYDQAVPVKESVRRIRSLDKSNITIRVYPQRGHGLAEPAGSGIYRMSGTFLGDLVDFIKKESNPQHHTRKAPCSPCTSWRTWLSLRLSELVTESQTLLLDKRSNYLYTILVTRVSVRRNP